MKKDPIDLHHLLLPTIGRARKFVGMYISKRLAVPEIDLTLKQFILLNHVVHHPRPQSDLVIITERDKGSLTRLIQSLERKGFVTRTSSQTDKRVNMVQASESGVVAFHHARPIVLDAFSRLTEDISTAQEEIIIKCMHSLMAKAIALIDSPNKTES